MRLIRIATFTLEEFESEPPKYAILSHVWDKEEVTLKDFDDPSMQNKQGFEKIKGFCQAVRQSDSSIQYVWVDTCCIDKSSSAELSEAINSMFRWYQNAQGGCYVYLADAYNLEKLALSKWFTRGWTLQELLAPNDITFYNSAWEMLGDKTSLGHQLANITGISLTAIREPEQIYEFSVAARMSWAAGRQTTREEDKAYCLLGIFGVNMPMLYGESSNAFIRLQQEIIKQSSDQSIFAWTSYPASKMGREDLAMLASSVKAFSGLSEIVQHAKRDGSESHVVTNMGLSIKLELIPYTVGIYLGKLRCGDSRGACYIFLKPLQVADMFTRIKPDGQDRLFLQMDDTPGLTSLDLVRRKTTRVTIPSCMSSSISPDHHGFQIILGPSYERTFAGAKIRVHEGIKCKNGLLLMPPLRIGTAAIVDVTSIYNTVHEVAIALGFDFDFLPYCKIIHGKHAAVPGSHRLLSGLNLYDDSWIAAPMCAYKAGDTYGHSPFIKSRFLENDGCSVCADLTIFFQKNSKGWCIYLKPGQSAQNSYWLRRKLPDPWVAP